MDALNQRQRLSLTAEAFAALLDDAGALHQFVLDSSPELLYLLDSEGRIRFINRRVESLLGFHPEELRGQHYEVLVDESFHSLARHVFDERRTGSRAGQPVALKLVSRLGADGARAAHPRGLWMELRAEGIYADPNERTAENYLGTCGAIRDLSKREGSQPGIDARAFHDTVTGLPNRTLFDDRLGVAITQAERSRRKLAVMFLDLNRFKRVNDRLGHSVGDRLLRAVAQRVRACLRQGDTLSRFGGDEFTLLVPSVRSRGVVERIAGKILDCFDAPFVIDGRRLRVGASIGIALYPEAGDRGDALIEAADIAMYHAKDQGGNGYRLYSETMNRGV
ncbi:MAG: diguanylate cyclase, partial [Gammaproteobacteria bacterium]|nr:diguanylate cyclase [Gammaproteobacteria bacterium]